MLYKKFLIASLLVLLSVVPAISQTKIETVTARYTSGFTPPTAELEG
jgi:hypothetical protein